MPKPSLMTSGLQQLDDLLATSNNLDASIRRRLLSIRDDLAQSQGLPPAGADMLSPPSQMVHTPEEGTMSPRGYLPVEDLEASRWLAKTFTSMRMGVTESVPEGVAQPTLPSDNTGMPLLDLSCMDLRQRFTRRTTRHTSVLSADRMGLFLQFNECFLGSLVFLPEVDGSEFDAVEILRVHSLLDERSLYLSVCATVFSRYSFIQTLYLDVNRLCAFLTAVVDTYDSSNPFHCALRAADVVQLVHTYFLSERSRDHFTDIELLGTLLAAVCLDAGHYGVTNDFLSRIDHPLVSIFGEQTPQESATLALTVGLLSQDSFNFMQHSIWKEQPELHLNLRSTLTTVILNSAARNHGALLAAMRLSIQQNSIRDEDVPTVLSCVVHAADYGYALKPRSQHIQWVTRLLTENTRQGVEEERRRLTVSPLCSLDAGEHAAAALYGLLRYVLCPFFEVMQPLLPETWTQRIQRNVTMYEQSAITNGKEDDDHATSPPILFECDDVEPWGSSSQHPCFQALRRLVGGQQGSLLDRKASQHAILHATPKRQLSMSGGELSQSSFSVSGHGSATRTDHYFSFLRMFESYDRDERTFADFSGNLVFLAIQLDRQYIGEYAMPTDKPHPTAEDCTQVAQLIVDSEQPPTTAEFLASPSKKGRHVTDAFILQLLHMFKRRWQEENGLAQSASPRVALMRSAQQQQSGMTDESSLAQHSCDTTMDGAARRRRLIVENPIYQSAGGTSAPSPGQIFGTIGGGSR